MERLALDTTFLIDLQNERRSRGRPRGALQFLRKNQSAELFLPSVALGEYLEGFEDPDGDDARALIAPLVILEVTETAARHYATATRILRARGRLIGTNDLWIGCTARAAALPVVTRNSDEFRRIPELEVIAYGPS